MYIAEMKQGHVNSINARYQDEILGMVTNMRVNILRGP